MKKYGLIGFPLSHSFSKTYFEDKFAKEGIKDHAYELFPIESLTEFEELLNNHSDLCGLNVTIPYKIGVMYYLDKVDPAAKAIDAVNCIKIVHQTPVESFFTGELSSHSIRLEGYNTDAYGFEESLKPLLQKHHIKALVLGSGGASRAVTYVLNKLNIDYKLVSRRKTRKQITYTDLTPEVMKEHTLIVNTTPLGMTPNVDASPEIPYDLITDSHLLYDLIYNPEETAFLRKGREQGAKTKNGQEMLYLQAEKSWDIWNSD